MQAVITLIRRRAVFFCAGGVLLSLWGPIGCGDGDNPSSSQAGGDAGEAGQGETGGGAGAGATCPTVQFVNPADGAELTSADDVGANCSDGFQYNVKVFTLGAGRNEGDPLLG